MAVYNVQMKGGEFMKKLSMIALAAVLTLSAASGFAKGSAYPACKDMKGKERSDCIKTERAKKAEANKGAKKGTKDTAAAPADTTK